MWVVDLGYASGVEVLAQGIGGAGMSSSSPRRHNRSFLAENEQKLIRWILPRLPESVTSLHLTIVGLAGSALTALALIACNVTSWAVVFVAIGVAINWFGDSLDGSLARFRNEERPRFGFLVDHTCDLFSQLLIIVAFGFSPYLSLVSALTILLCYLLFSAYTYIRAATHHIHQMAYIGVGATEFRILMIVWSCLGAAVGLHEPLVNGMSKLDYTILGLAGMAVCGLVYKLVVDAAEIAREEGRMAPAVAAVAEVETESVLEPLANS